MGRGRRDTVGYSDDGGGSMNSVILFAFGFCIGAAFVVLAAVLLGACFMAGVTDNARENPTELYRILGNSDKPAE